MSRNFFITSTGTGIGKTLVTSSLCWQLRQEGHTITALKPVISGYDATDLTNDSAQILMSCGTEPTAAAQEGISPWHFRAPLAPNMAATKEGSPVDFGALIRFCTSFPSPLEGEGGEGGKPRTPQLAAAPLPSPPPQGGREYVLVEGVGGIMVPLDERHTVLDWMTALDWPILLVCGTYLGSISHTFSAVSVLQAKNLPLAGIIVSESENGVSLAETLDTLKTFLPGGVPVVQLPRLDAHETPWKKAPPLSWLCQNPPQN